jgi:Bacterial regulatory proteins, tetR family
MEQVAAAAGVGKGTVFHRFGNRTGLMYALMVERAQALEEAVRSGPPPLGPGVLDRDRHPVYRFWHGHISGLIAAQRPDADAELIAHLLLGALHSEPILAQRAPDGPKRLAAAMRTLACAVLDAPPG